jgi:hypothetical protein
MEKEYDFIRSIGDTLINSGANQTFLDDVD